MKKFPILVILTAALIFTGSSFAAPRPIKARQKSIDLEFKVYRTRDMPPNWFKTYDDFYVTKRIDNNWIYGIRTIHGMKRTNIIVGTVDPYMIPELSTHNTHPAPGESPVYMPPLPPEMEEPQNFSANIPPAQTQTEPKTSEPPAIKEQPSPKPSAKKEASEIPEPDTSLQQKDESNEKIPEPSAEIEAASVPKSDDYLSVIRKEVSVNSWDISFTKKYTSADLKPAIEITSGDVSDDTRNPAKAAKKAVSPEKN